MCLELLLAFKAFLTYDTLELLHVTFSETHIWNYNALHDGNDDLTSREEGFVVTCADRRGDKP